MSDIRVFVNFPESATVFAGEQFHCQITFKNIAQPPGTSSNLPDISAASLNSRHGLLGAGLTADRNPRAKLSPLNIAPPDKRSERISPRIPIARYDSLGTSVSTPAGKAAALPSPTPRPPGGGGGGHKHKRSLSIISLGSDVATEASPRSGGDGSLRSPQNSQSRPRGHGRSASLQILPRRTSGITSAPGSATILQYPAVGRSTQPSTPMIVESNSMSAFTFPARLPSTPTTAGISKHLRSKSLNKHMDSPSGPPSASLSPMDGRPPSTQNHGISEVNQESRKASQSDLKSMVGEPGFHAIPPGRVISAHSVNGETPRSSGEFYSLSNSTTETLASEYDPRSPPRLLRSAQNRRHSLLSVESQSPESLMMGYAQILGTFTLDGSFVQTSIFDEVKRKGVVGGQMGGGVVGLDTKKNESGFLSGFGWGALGGGLSGLLGGNNVSSIAEMKSLANSKSIPILSTPQSILFVDLRLPPGESRSYSYKFTLPKGLPPSHKGKAIKISYTLVIGTQRPGKGVQQPTVIEVPFRVFPNVDEGGSMRTHDLMVPIVLLHDQAITTCLDDAACTPSSKLSPERESSREDFLAYVEDLLGQNGPTNPSSSASILSPSFAPTKRLSVYEDQPPTSREAIEMALRGVRSGPSPADGNCMFDIARNGRRVACVTLARPAYKLGEMVTAVIDFSKAQIPCYHINASLESSETIAASIALRSTSSIHRATRKVHSQHSVAVMFAHRVLFTPIIPSNATPEFSTSGVSSSWVLRLEFITPAISTRLDPENNDPPLEDLLEQTYLDDRGELYEPRQGLLVESFDASIPVKVYPNGADIHGSTSSAVVGSIM